MIFYVICTKYDFPVKYFQEKKDGSYIFSTDITKAKLFEKLGRAFRKEHEILEKSGKSFLQLQIDQVRGKICLM